MSPGGEVIVIGAGIIGINAALELRRRGHAVRVIDRAGVAAEASRGNAGAFAFADIEPLATPGILRQAPKWLLDPLGPLSVPLPYAPRIAPWLWRFWRASRPARYAAGLAAQARLMDLSRRALDGLVARVKGADLVQREGQLDLYEGAGAFEASLPGWELRRRHGVTAELLDRPEAIAEIQPGLAPRFTHAGFTPDWTNTVDPAAWTEHLARAFCETGGRIDTGEIRALAAAEEGVTLHLQDRTLHAAKVVVAAGAWSHILARTLGDRLPLETERGYNTTLPPGAFDLRTHLTFGAHGFVISRINGGVRVGGAVELGGLERAPNWKRADVLLAKAATFLPGLDTGGGTRWMGFRPSLPDSLPVIGPAPRAPRVIYAFGHGHLGLTQAVGTAELVSALIDGAEPPIPLAPYAPTRF